MGWGIVRKKRGEDGRRWTGTKPLEGGRRESTPSRREGTAGRRKEKSVLCHLTFFVHTNTN